MTQNYEEALSIVEPNRDRRHRFEPSNWSGGRYDLGVRGVKNIISTIQPDGTLTGNAVVDNANPGDEGQRRNVKFSVVLREGTDKDSPIVDGGQFDLGILPWSEMEHVWGEDNNSKLRDFWPDIEAGKKTAWVQVSEVVP